MRITPDGGELSFDLPIAIQQELGNAKPLTGIDLPKLLAGSGIATPSQAGTAIAAPHHQQSITIPPQHTL